MLTSPYTDGVISIKDPKVPIRPSAKGLAELKYVELQIKNLEVVPDFGYEGDNFCLYKEGVPGWHTLTDLIGNKDRYQWLLNYIKVNKLRSSQ